MVFREQAMRRGVPLWRLPDQEARKALGRPCNMAWFVSDLPLAAAGLRQNVKVFRTEADAADFVRELRAAEGPSSTSPYVEYRRGGKTLIVIGPNEIEGWLNDAPAP